MMMILIVVDYCSNYYWTHRPTISKLSTIIMIIIVGVVGVIIIVAKY